MLCRCTASEPRQESPVSSLSEGQVRPEQLASNVRLSIVYLFIPLAGVAGGGPESIPAAFRQEPGDTPGSPLQLKIGRGL